VKVRFGSDWVPPLLKLETQAVPGLSVQSAFEEHPRLQSIETVLQHTVSPVVRFRQNRTFGHVSGQLAQTPSLQLGVAPVPHPPHSIVPLQPSGTVPHWPLAHSRVQHRPSMHCCRAVHVTHGAPAVPQNWALGGVRHTVPSQQPSGQFCGVRGVWLVPPTGEGGRISRQSSGSHASAKPG
jgi:hypothetical protein